MFLGATLFYPTKHHPIRPDGSELSEGQYLIIASLSTRETYFRKPFKVYLYTFTPEISPIT